MTDSVSYSANYNADGGIVGEVRYVIGHLLGTAECALCDITHSPPQAKACMGQDAGTAGCADDRRAERGAVERDGRIRQRIRDRPYRPVTHRRRHTTASKNSAENISTPPAVMMLVPIPGWK